MPGSSTGDAWKSPGRRGPGRALPSRSAGHRRERLVAGVNLRTHAEPVQHSCRTTSAPMLTRFYLFYSSFSSSFFYLPMGYHSRPHLSDRQKPADLSVGAHPGFSPPDSGSSWQTAPQSPRWLIGLPSVQKASPARGIFQPESLPVCAPRWPLSRRACGCHCGRQDRGIAAVGFGKMFVGGSGGSVFAAGSRWWKGAEGGAGRLRLAVKRQRGAGP